MTLFSIITNLLHFGLAVVGLDYGYAGQNGVKEVHGSTPYGASTIADGDGSRQPSESDLGGARYQGKRIAEMAVKLAGEGLYFPRSCSGTGRCETRGDRQCGGSGKGSSVRVDVGGRRLSRKTIDS